MKEEIFKKLNLHKIKKSKVEKDLGMPQNSLSGMLKGSKEIPSKWVQSLTEYIERLDNPNQPQKEAQQEPITEKVVESTQNQEIAKETPIIDKYSNPIDKIGGYQKIDYEELKKAPIQSLVGDSNSKFDQLLKQFNSLVDLTDKPKDIKLKLEQIKETAKNSNLTPRQTDAIIDRCNNQLENKYNTSKHSLKLS